MIIAQISDTHLTLDAPDADRRLRDFAHTIADINALDPAPDVIVHTGDIVHNGGAMNMRSPRRTRRSTCCPATRTTGPSCAAPFPQRAILPPAMIS